MLVSDRRLLASDRLARSAGALAAAGVRLMVQLREKDLEAAALLEAACLLVEAARRTEAGGRMLVAVNGRHDVALAAGADAVHLPSDGAPPARVRQAVARRLRIGVSTHAPPEVEAAAAAGVDYVLFGPVFATPSKAGMGEPQGTGRLREAVTAAGSVPVFAVGGIDASNAGACREAGAGGIALIRAVLGAPDPLVAARDLVASWHAGSDAPVQDRPGSW